MKSPKVEVNPKAKQQNYHLPVDHGCSSHLLTSTSWWSSQKRVPHSRTHNKNKKGKLEPKVVLSCNLICFHSQLYIHYPSMLWHSKTIH